ncbi:beta-lactamase family protein [Chryseobacterium sp. PBS4-4]|uniref:Beta-lactamase family protein n=1 Tax=Chryseobacterium edaphi TaxID=2976532 RepID=A0ABT2W900_9FLAO|nr:beta-lactamase family protein [Chryseobacterium edaphi]MCU7618443.1 beta-lactamase family protein [Chryseobacterium edaphi]
MKKIFSLLLTILINKQIFAQTENYKAKIDEFQTKYNAGKYDEIFHSFSTEMKKTLPFESTNEFLKSLKLQAGKIENKEFIKYEEETYASYKTKFEKAVLSVNISLNENNQIDGLFITPYKESATLEANNIANVLSRYPKEIAQIVYSKAKDFPNSTQLSIAVIKNRKTNYYGIIKENDSIKPIENQRKVFEIGSITKVFTSTVLASLVEDKKINLADHVDSYYHFKFKENTNISFESLANHTSGLPRLPENLDLSNESNPYQDYGKKELENYLKNSLTLENKPSKSYAYSNLGAGLLGYTLGLSQKTSFQELLKKKIFDKYKMMNSFTNSQNLGGKLIKGLDINGEIIPNWDFDVLFGGGGILSTTEDLAKFAAAQFNSKNKELALTRRPTFDISEKMKIGLGWHILKSENGQNIFWHNGGTAGYSSSMTLSTDNKTAVIILSNVSSFNPIENIDPMCFELMQEIKK